MSSKLSTYMFHHFQAHPWFKGVEWNRLYQMKAAFIPEVNDEMDTQNFEKFEEVYIALQVYTAPAFSAFGFFCSCSFFFFLQSDSQSTSATKSGPWRKVGTFCY